MTTASVLFCLAAVLTICADTSAAGSVNCRKFVYHPKCRGVAAKRGDLPALVAHRHPDYRKQDDEMPDTEYVPVPVSVDMGLTNEALQAVPRRNSQILWSYLADKPTNYLLAHRKFDPEIMESSYDYE